MSPKKGVLIAASAAVIFAVLPSTVQADTSTTTVAPTTKATNNCCGAKPHQACKKTASGVAKNSCAADCTASK